MKLYIYFTLVFFISLTACEGPVGPEGPQGADGVDGLNGEEAYTFDYEGVDFTSSNGYSVLITLPESFTMLDSDVVLVYFLWDVDPDTGKDIWRALPQSVFTDNGLLLYNYDFTTLDVSLFLDADAGFDFNSLGATLTDGWVVRIVVVPGQFANGRSGLDTNDYYAVAEAFNLPTASVADKYQIVKRPE